MLKKTRLAGLAAVLLIATATLVIPHATLAQTPAPAPAAAPAAAPAEAPAEAPAAAKAPTSAKATEVVDNPYGLEALWKGGDAVARITLGDPGDHVGRQLVHHHHQGVRTMEDGRPGARRAEALLERAHRSPGRRDAEEEQSLPLHRRDRASKRRRSTSGLLGNVDMNEWITMSIQRAIDNVQSRTQDGLAFLATVGSTAPFVGLFGTVWGIYHALTAIGIAGQASIDKVAGPVGEALIMTAFGLAVAVPAVLGYNWLVRRNKSAMDLVRDSVRTCTPCC